MNKISGLLYLPTVNTLMTNEDNRRATIGLNGMLSHCEKHLSDDSLGQGATAARSPMLR